MRCRSYRAYRLGCAAAVPWPPLFYSLPLPACAYCQGKIMEEVERYQGLSSDVDAQKTMWTNKRAAMVAAHGAYALQVRWSMGGGEERKSRPPVFRGPVLTPAAPCPPRPPAAARRL